MANWIKIDRDIRRHWIWSDAVRFQWWVDLLMMASWEDVKVVSHANVRSVKRGQMIASVSFLAKRWGRDRKTVMKFLQTLSEEGMITRETMDSKTAILTVCNYEKYQTREDATMDGTADGTADGLADIIADGRADGITDATADGTADVAADTNKEVRRRKKKRESARARRALRRRRRRLSGLRRRRLRLTLGR